MIDKAVNAWNRMNVITRQAAGDYQPGPWGLTSRDRDEGFARTSARALTRHDRAA